MARHVLVAGIVAAFSLGALVFSLDASARPGGGPGIGRGGGGHIGGFHRGGVGFHRGIARPFVHGRHMHRHGGHHRFSRHGIHHGKHGHHHGKHDDKRGIGLSLPWAGVAYFGDALAAPGLIAPGVPDVNGGPGGAPVFYRHVCRSDAQVVPSGRGGETEVTVTRCYMVAD
jgi:hypothetical protein